MNETLKNLIRLIIYIALIIILIISGLCVIFDTQHANIFYLFIMAYFLYFTIKWAIQKQKERKRRKRKDDST